MFRKFPISYLSVFILNITEEEFHREIKPLIKADFKEELNKQNINNPDIGLDNGNYIYLIDPSDSSNFIETNVNIFDYI